MIRSRVLLSAAVLLGVVGCGAAGGAGSAGTAGPTADPALTKLGPDHGWSQTNVTVERASLACGGVAPDPTRGITPTSVRIGGLSYLTSPTGSTFAGVEDGARVRFERANAEGGVAGRRIEFTGVLDDGNDPARDSAQAAVLVQQQEVFAVAPLITASTDFLDTMCTNVVPFFGWGINPAFCGNAIGFGISGCQTPADGGRKAVSTGVAVAAARVLGTGRKTMAIVGEDDESSRLGNVTVEQSFEAAGFRTVSVQNAIPATGLSDPSPVVDKILRAKPAVVFTSTQLTTALEVIGALKERGYHGLIITPYYDPRLVESAVLTNTYAVLQWQPGFSTGVPAIAQMAKDFDTYAPTTPLSLPSMAGYWSADMLVKGLQATGRNLTVDRFLQVMNANYSNYVPGALPETRWPLNHVAPTPCGTLAHLAGGSWSADPEGCSAIERAP